MYFLQFSTLWCVVLCADGFESSTIQVGVKQEAYQLADGFTEGPVVLISIVIDEKGQSEDVERVAHGQVEHVDGGGSPALCAEHNHVERHGVQRQADHKDQGVADGEEDVFKLFIKFTESAGVVGHVEVGEDWSGYKESWKKAIIKEVK